MAVIQLAVSGMTTEIPRVMPYLNTALEAFGPFGITFQAQQFRLFNDDPELTGGWSSLHGSLAAYSNKKNPPSPAHMVITQWPPNRNRDINGCLIDELRGICAIYTNAAIYGDDNDLDAHRDLLIQVLIHELGHMLNLIHSDGDAAGYCNAIQPSADRTTEAVVDAWTQAGQEMQQNHESPVPAPNPMLYYPFDRECRDRLREAAFDPLNLPWQSEFRGTFGDPSEIQDRSLRLEAELHDANRTVAVRGGLYFTLTIRNEGLHPVRIPALIGPEYGSLRVAVQGPDGGRQLHRPPRLECSGTMATILPGEAIRRSFALASHEQRPLFAQEGEHGVEISLLHRHGAQTGSHGRTALKVSAREQAADAPGLSSLSKLFYHPAPRALPRTASSALDQLAADSAGYFHGHLVRARHTQRSGRRSEHLQKCLDPAAPTAILNAAALQLGLERMQRGTDYRRILAEYQKLYPAAQHEELLHSIRKAGKAWGERIR